MRDNRAYFTNLGIVKFPEFELTLDMFFDMMVKMISNDITGYNVSYDQGTNKYTIVYNSKVYEFEFGKEGYYEKSDAKEVLDKLVTICNNQKNLLKEEKKRIDYKNNKREIILLSAEMGITNTDNKRRAKIEMIKRDYKKNKYNIFKGMWEILKKINYGEGISYQFVVEFLISIIPAVVALGTGNILFLALFVVLALSSLSILDVSYGNIGFRGIYCLLFSIITLPINLGYNLVKKLIDVIGHNREINNIKKSIKDVNKTKEKGVILKSNVDVKEMENFISEVENKFLYYPTDLRKTYQVINGLKDKILLINDKSISSKFAKELYEIISYYLDASINIKEKIKVSNILTNQITDLSKRVDEILIKEKEEEEEKNSCNTMMETISYGKSIR